jgi:hypothetical protein
MSDEDNDRERALDRDESREPRAFSFPSRLNSRGTLQALLLERTEPDVNAAGVMNAWRPSDRSGQ